MVRLLGIAALACGALATRTSMAGAQAPEVQDAAVISSSGKPVDGGGSSTDFAVDLPDDATCPGDSAVDDFRVNTYMVPVDVDPVSLEFAGNGPEPQSYGDYDTFRMPLFDTEGASVAARLTAEADAPGEPGDIVDLPYVNFKVFEPEFIPPGVYDIGIVCGDLSGVTNVWHAEIAVKVDPKDRPAQLRWDVVDQPEGPRSSFPFAPLAVGGAGAALLILRRRRSTPQPAPASKEHQ